MIIILKKKKIINILLLFAINKIPPPVLKLPSQMSVWSLRNLTENFSCYWDNYFKKYKIMNILLFFAINKIPTSNKITNIYIFFYSNLRKIFRYKI